MVMMFIEADQTYKKKKKMIAILKLKNLWIYNVENMLKPLKQVS